jgi:hypothetical protein
MLEKDLAAVLCAGARIRIGLRGIREPEDHPIRQLVKRVVKGMIVVVVGVRTGDVVGLWLAVRACQILVLRPSPKSCSGMRYLSDSVTRNNELN